MLLRRRRLRSALGQPEVDLDKCRHCIGPRRSRHRLRQRQWARMPGAPSSATANGRALSALTGGNLDARRERQIWPNLKGRRAPGDHSRLS
jgi:hypothetical protein